MNMHLAQLNIARLRYDFDDPRVAEFMDNLERVNGIAERSEGFVWRLQDEAGDATAIQAFDDPQVIVNMSVWRSAEELEHFVWNTVHKQFYRKRAEWFSAMKSQHFVMWWVDEDHVPTVEEARNKLDTLERHGDSDLAFGWSHLPHIKLWQQARCA
jgi:hypothetical protein